MNIRWYAEGEGGTHRKAGWPRPVRHRRSDV